MAALMGRALSGSITLQQLLQHGDFGIGTFDAVDGEMVILNNIVYKINELGVPIPQNLDVTSPFANVCKFYCDTTIKQALNFQTLEQLNINPNYFYAIKIHGTFQSMHTRVALKQAKPYPTLLEITKKQAIFNYQNTTGTIVGFFSPQYAQGIGVGGFHLHYISDDLTQGGHIFNFDAKEVTIEISKPLNFQLILPHTQEYRDIEIDIHKLNSDIHEAESKR